LLDDLVADRDRPVAEDVGVDSGSMHEVLDQAGPGQLL
jgi:hypothetical protein